MSTAKGHFPEDIPLPLQSTANLDKALPLRAHRARILPQAAKILIKNNRQRQRVCNILSQLNHTIKIDA